MRTGPTIATIFGVAAALLLGGCSASLVSTKVPKAPNPGRKPAEGMFYTLPQTVVQVTLPVTLTERKAGPFDEFSELFFPGEKKVTPGRELSLKRARFATRGEPDPRQVYTVKAVGRGAIEQALTFGFTEQGAVTGLKAEVTNQTADLVLAGLKAGVDVLTRTGTVLVGGAGKELQELSDEAYDCDPSPDALSDKEALAHLWNCFLTREELRENFAVLHRAGRHEPYLTAYRGRDQQGDENEEGARRRRTLRAARETYLTITDLADGRLQALNNAALAGAGFEEALAKNAAAIASLKAHFLGSETETVWTALFEVAPDECDAGRQTPCDAWTSAPLLEYLDDQGLCAHMDLRGAPPPPKGMFVPVAQQARCASAHQVKLKLDRDPFDDQPVTRLAANFTAPAPAGLYFIVPAQMRAEIEVVTAKVKAGSAGAGSAAAVAGAASDGKDPEPGKIHLMIAQHGIVSAVPSKMGGKSLTHDLQFYDASGALKSYSLISKPLVNKDMVASISSSTNALLDARNAQRKAEEEAADPANKAKKQKELLESLLAIQKACAELENPPEECGK